MVQYNTNLSTEIVLILIRDNTHVRDIARQLNTSHVNVLRSLRHLMEDQVVDFRKFGKNNVYHLRNNIEAHVAINIAEACKVQTLQNDLVQLALDPSQLSATRNEAACAIVRIGDEEAKGKLKPLAIGEIDDDLQDELKGYSFEAVWPNLITAEELFSALTPPKDDSFMGADELIEAAKSNGLDGVCLTEHDAFWSQDAIDVLSRKHDFLVLPGCEINTDAGHLLVFGLKEYVFGFHKPTFLHAALKEKGALAIAAHPYRRRFLKEPGRQPEARAEMLQRAGSDSIFNVCHAIEAVNGRGTADENCFSQDLGEQLGMKMTGGSDAHKLEQMGTAATYFKRSITGLDDLIQELREGRFEAVDLRNGN